MDDERVLWTGHPSHAKDLGYHVLCWLFAPLVFPLFMSLARYLQTRFTRFEITSERIRVTVGRGRMRPPNAPTAIFNKTRLAASCNGSRPGSLARMRDLALSGAGGDSRAPLMASTIASGDGGLDGAPADFEARGRNRRSDERTPIAGSPLSLHRAAAVS